jgi:hypothetical protein
MINHFLFSIHNYLEMVLLRWGLLWLVIMGVLDVVAVGPWLRKLLRTLRLVDLLAKLEVVLFCYLILLIGLPIFNS